MLDEAEWAAVVHPHTSSDLRARQGAILKAYHRLTGFAETNANAVMHHRLIVYGPPCTACGKPLRTPRSRFCAACGLARAEPLTREGHDA